MFKFLLYPFIWEITLGDVLKAPLTYDLLYVEKTERAQIVASCKFGTRKMHLKVPSLTLTTADCIVDEIPGNIEFTSLRAEHVLACEINRGEIPFPIFEAKPDAENPRTPISLQKLLSMQRGVNVDPFVYINFSYHNKGSLQIDAGQRPKPIISVPKADTGRPIQYEGQINIKNAMGFIGEIKKISKLSFLAENQILIPSFAVTQEIKDAVGDFVPCNEMLLWFSVSANGVERGFFIFPQKNAKKTGQGLCYNPIKTTIEDTLILGFPFLDTYDIGIGGEELEIYEKTEKVDESEPLMTNVDESEPLMTNVDDDDDDDFSWQRQNAIKKKTNQNSLKP